MNDVEKCIAVGVVVVCLPVILAICIPLAALYWIGKAALAVARKANLEP